MNIVCLNRDYACSTAVLGSFYENDYSTMHNFATALGKLFKVEICSHTGRHTLHQYSFLLASTNQFNTRTMGHLTALGFFKHGPSHNEKNDTLVELWIISVHELMRRLKEMNIDVPASHLNCSTDDDHEDYDDYVDHDGDDGYDD